MRTFLTGVGFSVIVGIITMLSAGFIEFTRAMLSRRRRRAILDRGMRENLHALVAPKQPPSVTPAKEPELTVTA